MSWLERNQKIIAEARTGLTWKLGERHVSPEGTGFASVGSFNSEVIGHPVYAGIKFDYGRWYPKPDDERVCKELTTIDIIAGGLPYLAHRLPLFEGLLTDPDNRPLAVITEDFTQGGRLDIYPTDVFQPEMIEFFAQRVGFFPRDLERMYFMVGGELRYGDFDTIPHAFEDFTTIHQIERELGKYTIQVDRSKIADLID